MKIRWNEKYTLITIYACVTSVLIVVCIFLALNFSGLMTGLERFWKICSPLVYGFIIAYLLNPLMRLLEKLFRFFDRKKPHPKLKRGFALVLAYLLAATLIIFFILTIVPQVAQSYTDLNAKMSDYVSVAQTWTADLLENGENAAGITGFLIRRLDTDAILESVDSFLADISGLISNVAPYIVSYVGIIINSLKNSLLGIIFSVYFLACKEKLAAIGRKLLMALLDRKRVRSVLDFLKFTDETFGGFIIGKLLDSLIIGILTFIILAIIRMPYYPLISLIIGVTNVIPFFGPFIGAIPSIFFIFIASPVDALWFALIIFGIQQLDGNVIGPKILGLSTGLDSLGVVIGITVMSGLFGIPGMFFGVPLFALIVTVFDNLVGKRLKKRDLPSGTDDYREGGAGVSVSAPETEAADAPDSADGGEE